MPERQGKRCLLIDLDGTLADSLGVMEKTYERFIEGHGKKSDRDEFEQLNGPPLSEVVRRLQQAHGLLGGHRKLLANYERLIDQAYGDVAPMPGAVELLADAKRNNWTICVVTSNSVARCGTWLEKKGLSMMVDLMVCGEDVTNGKPDPEAYLVALERAGCEAQEALAIEDSPQGAKSALAAGIVTIGLAGLADQAAQWPAGVRRVESFRHIVLSNEAF